MKKVFILISISILFFTACTTKNKAYRNLEKSPCACFKGMIKESRNV